MHNLLWDVIYAKLRNEYFTSLLFFFIYLFFNLQCECEKSLARVWMQHKGKRSQIVLLGRCLEFHLSRAIMKIEVMQMNKRIAIGKCVIVFHSCHPLPKKVYNQMYLVEATALLLICAHSFVPVLCCELQTSQQQGQTAYGTLLIRIRLVYTHNGSFKTKMNLLNVWTLNGF